MYLGLGDTMSPSVWGRYQTRELVENNRGVRTPSPLLVLKAR